MMDELQRYVHNENIVHYQRLIAESERDPSHDEGRHQMLQRLLADEMAKDKKPPSGQARTSLLQMLVSLCQSAQASDLECPATGNAPTAIGRLLENSSLPLEEAGRLVAAYERTLRALHLVDRNDPVTQIVAKKVIEIGERGGDAVEISRLAVKELDVK